jgi:hypothetical protein
MRKRVAVVAAIWLAGAVVAAIGATAALTFAGAGLFGSAGQTLSQAGVREELAQQPAAGPARPPAVAPATPRGSTSPSPGTASGQAAAPREFTTQGGTVLVSCSGGRAWLAAIIPAQGYQVDNKVRGPAPSVWATLSAGATGVRVTATCSGGHPRVTSVPDDAAGGGGVVDDHGGGGGGGGRGGGGGGGGRGGGDG